MANDKLIIGLSGRKQSGKNTAANQIIAQYVNSLPLTSCLWHVDATGRLIHDSWPIRRVCGAITVEREFRISTLAFADALKKFCIDVLGLTHEQCYGTDAEKDTMTELKWDGLPEDLRGRYGSPRLNLSEGGDWRRTGPMTAREVMQVFGTDLMRAWYPQIWVNACIRKAKAYAGPLVLITDVRFPDEVEAIQAVGGKVIRLTRAPHADADQHESETALDRITERAPGRFDLVVPDGLSIEGQGDHLRSTMEQWFIEYGLIGKEKL